MNHIRDGLKEEGADLIYEANFGSGCVSKESFCAVFKRVCWWEDEDINTAAFEAMYPAFL